MMSDNMLTNIEKTDDPNRPIVSVCHEGIELRSRIDVQFASSGVSARWLMPDELSGRKMQAAHIPHFAMMNPYYKNGELQQKAISAIGSAMVHDYEFYQNIKRNGPIMVARLQELLAEELAKPENTDCLNDEEFQEVKSALRRRMKAGEITNVEFQRMLQEPTKFNKLYQAAESEAEFILMTELKKQGKGLLTVSDIKILWDHARSEKSGGESL